MGCIALEWLICVLFSLFLVFILFLRGTKQLYDVCFNMSVMIVFAQVGVTKGCFVPRNAPCFCACAKS